MRKAIISFWILLLVTATLSAVEKPFLEEYFQPRSIIAAFTQEAIGNRYGEIDFTQVDGVVRTKIESFDDLAVRYRIVDLVQMHEFVGNLDWNEKGVYLQNIYRIVLESNDQIEQALPALGSDPNILFAEYESINFHLYYTPNDPDFPQQWHHQAIQTPKAWFYEQGSSEIIVAITDSGTKWNHPDLQDNIWINAAELPGITIDWVNGMVYGGDGIDNDGNGKIDDVIGWDFVENNNNPYQNYPANSHGTHVAGCAGAVGDNNIGLTGTAMNVSLLNCKGAPSNAPSTGIQFAYQQVQYSADTGAHIINCSWIGLGDGNYPNSVVNYATNAGSLVIAGAGNNNVQHTDSYGWYPSDAENSLSVAATDQNDLKASFSDYGVAIDLTAPGVGIRSTVLNDGYGSANGTSMSSPVVAGVAALVKSIYPDMPPLVLKDRLMMTTDYIDDLNPDYAGLLGTGRINAFKATMFDLLPYIEIYNYTAHEHSGDGDGVPNPGEEIKIIVSLYNEMYWMAASGVTATLSTTIPEVDIIVGEVNYPNIDGGSIVFNTHQPFIFSTPETLNELTIPFTLLVTANQSAEYPFEMEYPVTVNLSLQRAGWPLELSGNSTSSAALVDLDGSGTKELIFGDTQGNLHVVDYNKTPLPGFPVNLGSNIGSAVAVADLNNNNSAEIVANTQNGMIYSLDPAGNILFEYNANGQLRSNPMLIDVNSNGNFEIVALTFTNPKLIILNHDGTEFTGFPVDLPGQVLAAPAAADLNGDGHKEIIFSTNTGNIHALSSSTGEDIPGWPVSIVSGSWNGPLVADVTGNNLPDVVAANIQGTVFAFDRQGNELFTRTLGNQIRAGIVVFDLNNDNNSEIIFADMGGNLYVTDQNGSDWGAFPVNTGSPIESTPVLADMNLDGNLDIIYGDNAGFLHALSSATGSECPVFPINIGRDLTVAPAIGYFDGSNKPDILLPGTDGKYNAIDYKHPIGEIGWGLFRSNNRRTGNFFDMLPVTDDNEIILKATELYGNYPNPFNPDTRISFYLAEESEVRITIFNIRGQVVRELLNDRMSAGRHEMSWNGTDREGRAVGSGVYFYRMESEEFRSTRKMMLLK
jgi:subtilisin family serine protease